MEITTVSNSLHESVSRRDLNELAGDERFKSLVWEMVLLHSKKQEDYGTNHDPLANIRASQEFGVRPWVSALVRMNDKMTRLKNFAEKGMLENESARDSFMDIAVYSLLALVLYDEEQVVQEAATFPEARFDLDRAEDDGYPLRNVFD